MINLIRVLEDRSLLISSKTAGVTGENNAEILKFIFPEKISGKNISELTKVLKIYNSTMEEPRSIALTNDEYNITDSMTNDTSSTIWLELSADNFLWMSEPYALIFVPYPTFVANPGGGETGPTGAIPTRLSQLYNDMGFITAALLPTKTSQLQNDSGYITEDDIPKIPTKTSDLTNDSGYITSAYHDDTKLDVSDAFSGDYDDLSNKPVIPTVPTDISAFNNDSGYITASHHDDSKQNAPSVVTSGTTLTLADNTEYRLIIADGDECTYTLPSGNYECYMKLIIESGATFTIEFVPPTDTVVKYIGSAPEFAAGEEWEISVKDGVIASAKVGDGT